jgi:hypothetical protein
MKKGRVSGVEGEANCNISSVSSLLSAPCLFTRHSSLDHFLSLVPRSRYCFTSAQLLSGSKSFIAWAAERVLAPKSF